MNDACLSNLLFKTWQQKKRDVNPNRPLKTNKQTNKQPKKQSFSLSFRQAVLTSGHFAFPGWVENTTGLEIFRALYSRWQENGKLNSKLTETYEGTFLPSCEAR